MNFRNIHIKEIFFLLVFLVALKFGITAIYNAEWFSHPEYIKYAWDVRNLDKLDVDQFIKISEEDNSDKTFLIYIGRKSCPVCVELLPKIKNVLNENEQVSEKQQRKIYYFDSEKYDSEKTSQIRESFGIKTVPSILVLNGSSFSVYDAKSIGAEEFSVMFKDSLI